MASLLSLPNFLSFLLPSTSSPPPKTPPSHVSLTASKPKTSFSISAQDDDSSSSLSPELSSVICPSLAYANTLFFKSAYNVQVIVEENEPEERLLIRFRREVMKAGVIQECKRRRFYENKQDKQKRKSREAARRNRRRRPQSRIPQQNREEDSAAKEDEDAEDNWELPEGDLPY
ncbi:hypothetical protein SLE2022_195080 [Rubroshorea leprosula]